MANKMESERKDFRFKVDENASLEAGSFSGYASIFGVVDSYGDVVDPGAFRKTLKEHRRTKLLWSHNAQDPGIGYVELEEDAKGLRLTGALYLEIERARDAYINLKNGTLDGLSIGFKTVKEGVDKETSLRHLKEIQLWEVSLCNFQACPGAVVTDIKALEEGEPEQTTQDPPESQSATPDVVEAMRGLTAILRSQL